MRTALIAIVTSVGLAGCGGAETPPPIDSFEANFRVTGAEQPGAPLPAGSYWMVWAHGTESWDLVAGEGPDDSCAVVKVHEVHKATRSVEYFAEWYPLDPAAVSSLVATESSGSECPPSGLEANHDADFSMGGFGDLHLSSSGGSAFFSFGDQAGLAHRGQTATISYEAVREAGPGVYRVQGTITIEPLGAWPQSGLKPMT